MIYLNVSSFLQLLRFRKARHEIYKYNCDEIVTLGDANLYYNKWNEPGFLLDKIAEPLKQTLVQYGFLHNNLGKYN